MLSLPCQVKSVEKITLKWKFVNKIGQKALQSSLVLYDKETVENTNIILFTRQDVNSSFSDKITILSFSLVRHLCIGEIFVWIDR